MPSLSPRFVYNVVEVILYAVMILHRSNVTCNLGDGLGMPVLLSSLHIDGVIDNKNIVK